MLRIPCLPLLWLLIYSQAALAQSFTPSDVIVCSAEANVNDQEFDHVNLQATFVDTLGQLWVSQVLPNGDIQGEACRQTRIDISATSSMIGLTNRGNGPEWSNSLLGPEIFYTKQVNNLNYLASAFFDGKTWQKLLLDNGVDRGLPLASRDANDPEPRIIYQIKTGTSIADARWREANQPSTEAVIPSTGVSGGAPRWVPGQRALTTKVLDGQGIIQAAIYFIDTQTTELLTTDAGDKDEAWMWQAPEFNNESLFYATVNGRLLQVYRKISGVWTLINVVNPFDTNLPEYSDRRYILSPEPFVYKNKSYVMLQLSDTNGQNNGPGDIWIASLDPATPFYRQVSSLDPSLNRRDPEYLITSTGAYVYYTEIVGNNRVLHRTDTGLGIPDVPLPVLTDFTPAQALEGTTVIITGTNLSGASTVRFNGLGTLDFWVDSPTQITAVVPAAATTGRVQVTTPGGTSASSTDFGVIKTPILTSFTPTSAIVGTSITVNGSNFVGVTAVRFNDILTSFTVNNATQLVAILPEGATTGLIAITNPGGTGYSANGFTVIPIPTLSSFTPPEGPVGTTVVLQGTGLAGATQVKFNGKTATSFTVTSPEQVTAVVASGTTSGPITVTAPGGTVTTTGSFTMIPPPTITLFTPSSGPPTTTVTITGTNFTRVNGVSFNGTPASFTVSSDTQILATVPMGATSGSITVTTLGGTTSSFRTFSVNPAPTITGLSPTSGPVGAIVTLTGSYFTSATAVTFNRISASFTVNSATQIKATVPTGATSGSIQITTPSGTGTSATGFTVIPLPTLTSFSPSTGPTGTVVTLAGSDFTGTTAVRFNGKAAMSFVVNSPTQITATVATGTMSGLVQVTTPGGTNTSSQNFTILLPPTISLITPTSGPLGTAVVLTGSNFTGATGVFFNGVPATFTVNSATQITASASATGMIKVTTSGGSTTSTRTFTVR